MPTFAALLQDVLDHPDDVVPRQILGDFLLDQPDAGDQARGEFIHVQCRLAGMAEDPERPELERRQAELLPEHPQRWARPFRRRQALGWTFGRGLVEGLTLRAADFDRMADLLVSEQPVQRLRLLGDGWANRLRDWAGLGRIRALDLVWPVDLYHLSPRLTGLRELTVPVGGWTDQLRNAPWLASLEALHLRPYPYRSSLRVHASHLPRLRALKTPAQAHVDELLPQLRELAVTGVNLADLISVARKSALSSLTVERCHGVRGTPRLHDLLRLPALATLRSLEVRETALTDASALVALLAHGRLTHLTLHDVIVKHLTVLADSGNLSRLRELAVTRTRGTPLSLPEGHLEALAAADLRSLTSLSLGGYDLRTNDVLDLLGAPWIDQLHTLSLRECKLNPHVVSVIVRRDWPGLARLDLRGNRLGTEANEQLRKKFGVRVRYSS